MAKKIDYASLYTLRKDGRYAVRGEDGKFVYDRDPERLWHKLNDPKEEKPLLFSDVADMWYNNKYWKIEQGTRSSYKPAYERAVEEFGDVPVTEVEANDIQNHLIRMKDQGMSASTIKTQRTVYRQIFQFGASDKKIGKSLRYNPVLNVSMPTGIKPAKKREAPEDEIVQKIKKSATTAYWGMFAFFLMCTGFRRGEALAVQWKNIDFEKKTISCEKQVTHRAGEAKEKNTKTVNGVRVVPLLKVLADVLVAPENASPDDYVFYGSNPSKPIAQATYDRRWMHYCTDMGFISDEPEERTSTQGKRYIVHHYKPTLTAHILRHGYATLLFEAGVDVYTAQKLLGHANIETTISVYTHLRERQKSNSIQKIDSYLADIL